jgi:hypothetical protein
VPTVGDGGGVGQLTDYALVDDHHYLGHGVNGKEMWVYYSEVKNVICCGDKDTSPQWRAKGRPSWGGHLGG